MTKITKITNLLESKIKREQEYLLKNNLPDFQRFAVSNQIIGYRKALDCIKAVKE